MTTFGSTGSIASGSGFAEAPPPPAPVFAHSGWFGTGAAVATDRPPRSAVERRQMEQRLAEAEADLPKLDGAAATVDQKLGAARDLVAQAAAEYAAACAERQRLIDATPRQRAWGPQNPGLPAGLVEVNSDWRYVGPGQPHAGGVFVLPEHASPDLRSGAFRAAEARCHQLLEDVGAATREANRLERMSQKLHRARAETLRRRAGLLAALGRAPEAA